MSKLLSICIVFFSVITSVAQSQALIQKYHLPKNLEMVALNSINDDGDKNYEYILQVDLKHSKLVGKLTDFKEENENSGDEREIKNTCDFQTKISKADLQKMKALLAKVNYCKRYSDSDIAVDYSGYDYFQAYTEAPTNISDGKFISIDEFFDANQGIHRYFCGGGQNFYDFVKSVTAPVVPANCPQGYPTLFKIN